MYKFNLFFLFHFNKFYHESIFYFYATLDSGDATVYAYSN